MNQIANQKLKRGSLVFIMILLVGQLLAQDKPKALLISGNFNHKDPEHPYITWTHEDHNDIILDALEDIVDITETFDAADLNPENLSQYDIILNNALFLDGTLEQQDAFYDFIADGKSYLAIHSGIISFIFSDRYKYMVGAEFVRGYPPQPILVQTYNNWYGYETDGSPTHPITEHVDDFTTPDEIYMVHTNTTEMEVLARADNHPVLWWRPYFNGKVMCLTLGHDHHALANPGFQKIMRNSVSWLLDIPAFGNIPSATFKRNSGAINNYFDLKKTIQKGYEEEVAFKIVGNSNPSLVKASINANQEISFQFADGQTGNTKLTIAAIAPSGFESVLPFEVSVNDSPEQNLAVFYSTKVTASSTENNFHIDPSFVHDGMHRSRWSSHTRDEEWIMLDLGDVHTISRVNLHWEAAYGKAYEIQVATKEGQWKTVAKEENGDGRLDEHAFEPVKARYVRMQGVKRGTDWGYSLFEFEVFGE